MKKGPKQRVTDNMGLVYMVARSYRKTSGLPMEELVAEACVGLVKAALQYDPRKGEFSTWAVFRMRVRLNTLLAKTRAKRTHEVSNQVENEDGEEASLEPICFVTPEDLVDFKQRLELCSVDSREIARIIFESPGEFLELAKARKLRGRLKNIFRERGWAWSRIWECLDNGFDELREVAMGRE